MCQILHYICAQRNTETHTHKRANYHPRRHVFCSDVIINNTNDSAPGPDGVPFAAYRAIPELAAKVFAAAIEGMMSGNKPSKNLIQRWYPSLAPKKRYRQD